MIQSKESNTAKYFAQTKWRETPMELSAPPSRKTSFTRLTYLPPHTVHDIIRNKPCRQSQSLCRRRSERKRERESCLPYTTLLVPSPRKERAVNERQETTRLGTCLEDHLTTYTYHSNSKTFSCPRPKKTILTTSTINIVKECRGIIFAGLPSP
jgi:hypothetical protein